MYDFNFSFPPDYALVIRALCFLEGMTKALDPDFKIIESANPFVIGRLLADPSPDMRQILRELLICDDGSIRWNRLERLIAAISQQSSESSSKQGDENTVSSSEWRSLIYILLLQLRKTFFISFYRGKAGGFLFSLSRTS